MRITSAKFIKGIVGTNDILEDGTPQVAFIGRSNAGKSSVINSLTNQKNLAITSAFPGRTQQINLFLINKSLYLVDLPGYGFAKTSRETREQLQRMIYWYLFTSDYEQKRVLLIIDANVGPTETDLDMLYSLDEKRKSTVIVANKVDKIKTAEYQEKMKSIQAAVGDHKVIPYSSVKKIGINDLMSEIL